jgi:hypothetical protein
MSQYISLQQAIAMTTLYRGQKENILADAYKGRDILALSETFDRDICDTLLAKPDCAKLRIYYGMDESLKVHAILVPVNDNNEDILPDSSQAKSAEGRDIGELAVRCPPICPTGSPLNP